MARTFITRHTADEPVDLGTKRLYVNAVIKSNCPACGTEYVRDCSNKPLSYPTANSSFTMHAYCQNEECNHEWPVGVFVLRLNLELIDEQAE